MLVGFWMSPDSAQLKVLLLVVCVLLCGQFVEDVLLLPFRRRGPKQAKITPVTLSERRQEPLVETPVKASEPEPKPKVMGRPVPRLVLVPKREGPAVTVTPTAEEVIGEAKKAMA